MQSQQFLTFNSRDGAERFLIWPQEETEETAAALKEPMPLKTTWALWEQISAGGYNTRKVCQFSTAQEFWRIWNGVPQPSELLEGKRYFRDNGDGMPAAIDAINIFREGIQPEWEDAANAKGGHFQMICKLGVGGPQIDEYWNNLILAMIGETMECSSMITGVRLVDKLGKGKGTDCIRFELWYHSKSTVQEVNALKRSMEKTLLLRIDGTVSPSLKGDQIQDQKHASK